jgi:ribosomal protein S18 acetylase RimI-like enzyme
MYGKVLELAKDENVSQIRLYVDKNNTPAQRVYQKLGMEECHYSMYESHTPCIKSLSLTNTEF